MKYNKTLAARFAKDYNVTVPIFKEEYFMYYINLYEDYCGSLTKWNEVVKEVDEKFDGDAEQFLTNYYMLKEEIIKNVKENKAFKDFEEFPINFKKEYPAGKHKSIYNNDSTDRTFISIDLAQGNFQAMKYICPEIFEGNETYEEWIKTYTDMDYFINSKYTRQRVFGELNPKRQMAIEKSLIANVYEDYREMFPEPEVFNADEIIFDAECLENLNCEEFEEELFKKYGIRFHVEKFTIEAYRITNNKGETIKEFFVKRFIDCGKKGYRIVGVPLCFHAIVYKELNGQEINFTDKCFMNEGLISCFIDESFGTQKYLY